MCIVSFNTKEMLNITIYNQYSGLELMSPVYCSNGTTSHLFPSQRTGTGNTMKASFGIYPKQHYFNGALLYKLQRKHTTKTNRQSNNSKAPIEDKAISIYLLVAWNVKDYKHKFCVCPIECTDDFTLDEDVLWALHKKYANRFYANYKARIRTWLMHGSAVLKTRWNIKYGSDYKLDIIISKGTRSHEMKKPIRIDSERSVLSLLMLIVLIYTVSLLIKPTFKLNIHNQ
jgi:hypothetical protein